MLFICYVLVYYIYVFCFIYFVIVYILCIAKLIYFPYIYKIINKFYLLNFMFKVFVFVGMR